MSAHGLVIDACSLINLLATEDEDRIIATLDVHLITTPLAKAEVRFRRGPPDADGMPTQVPLDLDRLMKPGALSVRPIESAVQDAFVDAVAAGLRDADASVVALAGSSGLPLASDDNRVRKVACRLYPALQLSSTSALVRDACRQLGVDSDELRRLAHRLSSGGNFLPPKTDEHRAWFEALLDDPE